MQLKHVFVTLIDLFEEFPFTVEKEEDLERMMEEMEKGDEELFRFVQTIEDGFASTSYIGQDVIQDKFYQRFLFEGGGFMEIMQEAPLSIVGHFTSREDAEEFRDSLVEATEETVDNEKALEMMVDSIEIGEESGETLSYEKWSQMKEVR